MKINGESIYGTQASPFSRLPWGRATAKETDGNGYRLYLHVFKWPESGELFLPGLNVTPVKGTVLGGPAVETKQLSQVRGGIQMTGLPTKPVHPAATVIALDFDQTPTVAPFRIHATTDGSFTLEPADATVKNAKYHDNKMFSRSNIDSWKANSKATFPLQVETAGKYEVQIELAAAKLNPKAEFMLSAGDAKHVFKVAATGGPKAWKKINVGSLDLSAGKVEFQLSCKSIAKKGVVKITAIALKPAG